MTAGVDLQSNLTRLAEDPSDTSALEAVESALGGEGRWEELLRVYEDSAQRLQGAKASSLFRNAAAISVRELLSTPRAESYLRRAIEVDPTDAKALKDLREIYLAQRDYDRGVDIYEGELLQPDDQHERAMGV